MLKPIHIKDVQEEDKFKFAGKAHTVGHNITSAIKQLINRVNTGEITINPKRQKLDTWED